MKYNLTDYPELDYFTYSMFYSYLANKLKNGDTFVEIGSWLGQSAIYMADKIKQRKITIKLYTIDIFDDFNPIGIKMVESMPGDNSHWMEIAKENKVYETFLENIEPYKDQIISIKGNSQEVYKQFDDESIDVIFFDGDHDKEGFKKDIELWYPKVKYGGIFSGHDYIWGGNGVKSTIDAFSGFKAKPFGFGDTWFYEK